MNHFNTRLDALLLKTSRGISRFIGLVCMPISLTGCYISTHLPQAVTEPVSPPLEVVTDAQLAATLEREYLKDSSLQSNLDRISRSEITYGNEAQVLVSGIMTREVRKALIDRAKISIAISVYSINNRSNGEADREASELMERLEQALRRDVRVYLMVDGFTSAFTGIEKKLKHLRDLGAKIGRYRALADHLDQSPFRVFFNAVRLHREGRLTRNRMHEKVLLVDRTYAVVGGANWGQSYATGDQLSALTQDPSVFNKSPLIQELGIKVDDTGWKDVEPWGWRDTDVLLKGPVVDVIVERVQRRWLPDGVPPEQRQSSVSEKKSESLSRAKKGRKSVAVRYITQQPLAERVQAAETASSPGSLALQRCPQADITNFYLNAIRGARHQIIWGGHSATAMYEVLDELVLAAQRGVQIYIITNSREAAAGLPDGGEMFYTRSQCWAQYAMGQAPKNLRIFEWQRDGTYLDTAFQVGSYHSKVFSVDGYLTSIGSYNIAPGSYCGYTENTAVIISSDFARKVESILQTDLTNTRELRRPEVPNATCENLVNHGYEMFIRGYLRKKWNRLFSDVLP